MSGLASLLILSLVIPKPIAYADDVQRGRLLWTDPDGSPDQTPFFEVTTPSGGATDDGDDTMTLNFATSVSPTFTGDVTISDTSPSLVFTDTTASEDDFELIVDGSVARYVNTTDGITTWIHYADNGVGLGELGFSPSYVWIVTSATGNNSFRAPQDSIGVDELDTADEPANGELLTFQSSSGRMVWAAGGSGAPTDAEYIVSEDNSSLSADVFPSAANQVPNSSSSTAASWTDAPTIATLNTGQGANELYAMDQNVRTTDSPTFLDLLLTGNGPDLSLQHTGGDKFGFHADSTQNVFTFKNATDQKDIWRVFGENTFETVAPLTASGGADLRGQVNTQAASSVLLKRSLTIGAISYVFPAADGTNGQVLTTDGSGGLIFTTASSGTPGGSNTQVQYNNSGSFGGSSGLTLNATQITDLTFNTGAIASSDLTTGLSDETGSGVSVFATSPTFVTSINLETVTTGDDPNQLTNQARTTTTNATPTTLQTIAITASRTYLIRSHVVARRTGGAAGTADDGASYTIESAFTTKTGTVTQLGTSTINTYEDNAALDAVHAVSGANVIVQVTGDVDNNYTWHVTSTVSFVGT